MASDPPPTSDSDAQCFAFVFPLMAGCTNPSLPVARALVESGHVVHYLCFPQFREAIEDTGAAFHSALEFETELYSSRQAGAFGAMVALQKEYGLEEDGEYSVRIKMSNVQLALQLPGVLRFLQEVRPNAILYDPVISREAAVAGQVMDLPTVALLSFAGPAAWASTIRIKVENEKKSYEQFDQMAKTFEPNLAAVSQLNKEYGLDLVPGFNFGQLEPIPKLTLVTTIHDLRALEEPELLNAYEAAIAKNIYLGPLLDKAGAKRAGGFKMDSDSGPKKEEIDLASLACAAKAAGRQIVIASMGTMATGDHPTLGWNGRTKDVDGTLRGLSGRQLCHAAWRGVFNAFGSSSAEEGAFIALSVGPQTDPLGDLAVPPNACCMPFFAQVDVLKAGADVFLTHGGQNSFMESLAEGVPVVVCPTAGDQFDNAKKAVELGVGLDAGRPDPNPGDEIEAADAFSADVRSKLLQIIDPSSPFTGAAKRIQKELHSAGGVPSAADLLLKAALAKTVEGLA